MLHLLDEALEEMFRTRVPLHTADVDVTFGSPSADWAAGLARPTVNLFLWGTNLSASQAQAGMHLTERDGHVVRRPPLPRIECSYLITAWTAEIRDEHQLLGALLGVALTESTLSPEFLPAPLRALQPAPTLTISRAETPRSAEFWSAVGGRLKPGLDLLVSATIDAGMLSEIGPPVTSEELVVRSGEAVSGRRAVGGEAPGARPGTVVRTRRGAARVGPDGRFTLPGRPGDAVIVEEEPVRRSVVPEHGPVEVD